MHNRSEGASFYQKAGMNVKVGTPTITVLDVDGSGHVLLAKGATLPTDGDAGYAVGCKFIVTGGSAGSIEYINEGSATSADFNQVTTTIRYAEVTISAAEMLALNATPKTLVAAPGAGKMLVFHGAVAILDYNSAAYAGIAAGEDLAVKYTNGSGAAASTTLETTGFLDQTSDQIRTHKAIATDLTPVANAALVLHLASGEITTGNSPLRYKVWYSVVSTGL